LSLGLKQEEHYKLARIRVDIPNHLDEEWALDVRKSKATPPPELKADFRRIARATRQKAAEVYRHRGKRETRNKTKQHVNIWLRKFAGGRFSYVLNRKHPLVERAIDTATEPAAIRALITHIEHTIPYQDIWIDSAENPDGAELPYSGRGSSELLGVARQIYEALLARGLTQSEAIDELTSTDLFTAFPEIIAAFESQLKDSKI